MIKNYFKIAWRSLLRNKWYSVINIGGLAVGMAVSILIGFWVWNELSFNKNFKNYDRIAQVWQFVTFDAGKSSYDLLPIPLAERLRNSYPDFQRVSLSSFTREEVLTSDENKSLLRTGNYVEPDFNEMLSLNMIEGTRNSLKEANTILISGTFAKDLFGDENPLGKGITINNKLRVKIAGVYEDFPSNSTFKDVFFLAPWELFAANDIYAKNAITSWDENSYQIFVQLRNKANFSEVSGKIRDIRMKMDNPPPYKPEFFLHPMYKWHLYSEFKNGQNIGGLIQFVWLFGVIGILVLILACINFMNLATARSKKRAKEVGLRKSIGSTRWQLIFQFLSESFIIVLMSFLLSLILVLLILPLFNDISGKRINISWSNPWLWFFGISITLITGLLSASYPALYLSSFKPVKVLKGSFNPGKFASLPRKVLVIFQFTISVALMIGILTVFQQIRFAQNRPVGYNQNSLVEIRMHTPQLYGSYETLRAKLLNSGAVQEMSESVGSVTDDYGGTTKVTWQGKDPDTHPLLMSNKVTQEFGKTIGWQIIDGRDFSREFSTDNASVILNESAVKLMGFKIPLSESITWNEKIYKVIGITTDVIKESPFIPVKPTFFILDYKSVNVINLRLAPQMSINGSLSKVKDVLKECNPAAPFDYRFVDEKYAGKFSDEKRIGKLSGFFAILGVFISCLGIFGLASFIAEQRTKEIGVRKTMGATGFTIWQWLSKDYLILVVISCLTAIPVSWYYISQWLQNYIYHTELEWWFFAVPCICALVITQLTVSFQVIRAALINPVEALRYE